MFKLFKKAESAPPPKDSIAKLRETLELLEKREDYLQTLVNRELKVAKENATKDKRKALMALKRKKTYESQMVKISGARMTIEQQVMTLEGANVSLAAMNAMKMGASSLRRMHNNMTVDDVDDTMEEIREQMDIQNEISDAISQPLGTDLFDEDELEAELAQLEEEFIDETLLNGPSALPSVPNTALPAIAVAPSTSVPSAQPVAVERQLSPEEQELAELEAAMAF
jgi:charged multivesicular body protein 4A/B